MFTESRLPVVVLLSLINHCYYNCIRACLLYTSGQTLIPTLFKFILIELASNRNQRCKYKFTCEILEHSFQNCSKYFLNRNQKATIEYFATSHSLIWMVMKNRTSILYSYQQLLICSQKLITNNNCHNSTVLLYNEWHRRNIFHKL